MTPLEGFDPYVLTQLPNMYLTHLKTLHLNVPQQIVTDSQHYYFYLIKHSCAEVLEHFMWL